ncbi:MerR family transcriptional regulator [Streptomyces virginiae]|uniref:MerR family transcriptional regulator n=1 Tax=Streptomyces TaxID=1883 RepID=UPI000524FF10|nr:MULTISPECIES: MerR family transcriptional regulator [Streptomyces]MCX4714810.1 MerR family transcriptional regulator [Streptomyces virginiae]MCX5272528.1 MerR family transcriptional regulator [Streptomyces virginiae]MYV78005.1 MerR family transcriptional regulator [Streptomyces sp. SID1046]WSC78707.1 MerR family transcriptional regulator [Streptomyces virginiae]
MRIGELSRRTGVPVPTIKYYVREGLLPPGELSSPNQASYDDGHERRLRLIRALLEVGGLSVAAIGDVLVAIDDKEQPVHKLLGAAAQRLVPEYGDGGGHDDAEAVLARERVARLIEARGWHIQPGNKAADALAAALASLARVGHGSFAELLDDYADAAERVARVDLEYTARRADREGLVEAVVVGTVVGDAVFAALRRMAQVDASSRLFAEERRE